MAQMVAQDGPGSAEQGLQPKLSDTMYITLPTGRLLLGVKWTPGLFLKE